MGNKSSRDSERFSPPSRNTLARTLMAMDFDKMAVSNVEVDDHLPFSQRFAKFKESQSRHNSALSTFEFKSDLEWLKKALLVRFAVVRDIISELSKLSEIDKKDFFDQENEFFSKLQVLIYQKVLNPTAICALLTYEFFTNLNAYLVALLHLVNVYSKDQMNNVLKLTGHVEKDVLKRKTSFEEVEWRRYSAVANNIIATLKTLDVYQRNEENRCGQERGVERLYTFYVPFPNPVSNDTPWPTVALTKRRR